MSWNLPAAGHEEQTSEDVYINSLQGADHNSEGDDEVVRYLEMTNKPDRLEKTSFLDGAFSDLSASNIYLNLPNMSMLSWARLYILR
jgi:hypothetical protein